MSSDTVNAIGTKVEMSSARSNSSCDEVTMMGSKTQNQSQQSTSSGSSSQSTSPEPFDDCGLPDYEDEEESPAPKTSLPAQTIVNSSDFITEFLEDIVSPPVISPEESWAKNKVLFATNTPVDTPIISVGYDFKSAIIKARNPKSGYGQILTKVKKHAGARRVTGRMKKRTGRKPAVKNQTKSAAKSFLEKYQLSGGGKLSDDGQTITMPVVEDQMIAKLINSMAKADVIAPMGPPPTDEEWEEVFNPPPPKTQPMLEVGSMSKRNINGKREATTIPMTSSEYEESWRTGVFCQRVYKKMKYRDTDGIMSRRLGVNIPANEIARHLVTEINGLRHYNGISCRKPEKVSILDILCQQVSAMSIEDPSTPTQLSTDVLEARGMDTFLLIDEHRGPYSWAGYHQHDIYHPVNAKMDYRYHYATFDEPPPTSEVSHRPDAIRTVKKTRRSSPYALSKRMRGLPMDKI